MRLDVALDPVTHEVVKHRIRQINDEQAATILTISASPIVVEGNDFNVGLFTADGDIAIGGPYVVTHVTTMDTVIKNIIATVDEINDGDVFLVNDPYLGALHQNDVAVAGPLFFDGRLVAWVGNVLHHADLAGIDEGSFCINARNVFQESPRYFLKLVDRGRLSREVERTFVMNSRLPETVALDLRAQLGALNVARTRLGELFDEVGVETVLEVMRRSLDVSERQLRERLREIPDGEWRTEIFMDGDRVGSDRIIRVQLALRKTGERLEFDYEGTDAQSDGATNAPFHAAYAGTIVPIYAFLCDGDIDWNGSVKRLVDVSAPLGSVMNAQYPAAVSICSIGFTWLATAAAVNVVAQMLSASEALADRVCPSWNSSSNGINLFGLNRRGKTVGALLSDHRGGGAGGRSFADGYDNAGKVTTHLGALSNVESQEWKLPLLYLYRRQLPDSGGPGRFRGGMTSVAAVAPHKTERLIWKAQNTAGSDQSNAAGIHGGFPGAGSHVSVARGTEVRAMLASSHIPTSVEDFGERVEHLPTKSEGVLGKDDVLVFFPPGGGGFGDPIDREPERVLADVRAGSVSVEGARRHYGVVIDGEMVDPEATERLRHERRVERLGNEPSFDNWGAVPGAPAVVRRFGHCLEVVVSGDSSLVRCGRCGFALGPAAEDPRLAARQRTVDLREAGPWLSLRYGGVSPNFHLVESFCPGCGTLIDVAERRSSPEA